MWHRSKEHIQDILKYCTTLLTNEDNFDFISGFFTCADACERILSQGGIESLRFESYSLPLS